MYALGRACGRGRSAVALSAARTGSSERARSRDGALRQAGDLGRLGDREICHCPACRSRSARRLADPVGAASRSRSGSGRGRGSLRLVKWLLDAAGQDHLADLAPERCARETEQESASPSAWVIVLAPCSIAAGAQVHPGRTQDGAVVDSRVLEEGVVLRRDEGQWMTCSGMSLERRQLPSLVVEHARWVLPLRSTTWLGERRAR